jgi:hypothetical protein
MIELIAVGAAVSACVGGYVKVRQFVRRRLRFVDAVQSPGAPIAAGAAAALAAAPVVWVLPVIGAGAALAFGAGVGLGVRRGARDIRDGTRLIGDG